jgi:hypothetical protein
VFGAMQAGLRYVRYAPALSVVLVRAGIFILCGTALWALLPLVARQELGLEAVGYGVLLGCLGLGAVKEVRKEWYSCASKQPVEGRYTLPYIRCNVITRCSHRLLRDCHRACVPSMS